MTGGGGGLGAAAARLLARRGWWVFAGDLPGPALDAVGTEPGVSAVELDVTDDASVAGAVDRVRAEAGGLDAVVNFAGILEVGSVAELPVEVVRRVLEVNVLGTYRVNAAALPSLVERRGRIVNISSETGWQSGAPFNGAYAMSKHAVEAYSDSLRRELALVGVRVVKVQPGPFRTSMTTSVGERFTRAAERSERFGAVLRYGGEVAAREERHARDPSVLAEVVHHALTTRRPRPAYSVHPGRSRVLLERLPTRVADAVITAALRRKANPAAS